MRLQHYLTEEVDLYDFWQYWWPNIRNDCKPYLKDVKACGNMFWRRMRGNNFQIKKVRKNRRPTDTPRAIHQYWNKIFQKKFGWKPRSEGLFVWTNRNSPKYTPQTRLVFPIGQYEALWSPYVMDLYVDTDADVIDTFLSDSYNLKTVTVPEGSEAIFKKLQMMNFVQGGKFRFSISQVRKIANNETTQTIAAFWKWWMENVVLESYRETTIKEIKPAAIKVETILKCDKYYSIRLGGDESRLYELQRGIAEEV